MEHQEHSSDVCAGCGVDWRGTATEHRVFCANERYGWCYTVPKRPKLGCLCFSGYASLACPQHGPGYVETDDGWKMLPRELVFETDRDPGDENEDCAYHCKEGGCRGYCVEGLGLS